jgi:hypothetical protein
MPDEIAELLATLEAVAIKAEPKAKKARQFDVPTKRVWASLATLSQAAAHDSKSNRYVGSDSRAAIARISIAYCR